jgi:DNA-binding LacI/PurR family transcriptional regulator
VAALAGVSQPTVSRWMNYETESLAALTMLAVFALEQGLGLEQGALSTPPAPFAAKRGA